MRNLLLVAALALVSVSAVACGDADTNTSKRGGAGGSFPDPYQDDDPGPAPATEADPTATSKPAAPTTEGTSTGAFAIKVDNNTPQVDLAAKTALNVTVTAQNGFTGNVDLSATGLPAGVTAVFTPASVTVGATPATAKVEFTSTADTAPTPAGVAAKIHGAGAAAAAADANLTFKVNNALLMHIPTNISALNQASVTANTTNTALSAQFAGKTFVSGIAITVINDDSVAHEIHADNTSGFLHGKANIAPGQLDKDANGNTFVRTVTSAPKGYLHGEATGMASPFTFAVK